MLIMPFASRIYSSRSVALNCGVRQPSYRLSSHRPFMALDNSFVRISIRNRIAALRFRAVAGDDRGVHPKPFRMRSYGRSSTDHSKRLMVIAKSFRMRTYEKSRGWGWLSLTPNPPSHFRATVGCDLWQPTLSRGRLSRKVSLYSPWRRSTRSFRTISR